jgi:hypothetical protein
LAGMLGKLEGEEQRLPDVVQLRGFNTHPDTARRIQRLNAQWKKLKNKTGFIDFSQTSPGP